MIKHGRNKNRSIGWKDSRKLFSKGFGRSSTGPGNGNSQGFTTKHKANTVEMCEPFYLISPTFLKMQ